MARSADVGEMNLVAWNAGLPELIPRGDPQIQEAAIRSASRRQSGHWRVSCGGDGLLVEPSVDLRVGKAGGLELGSEIGTDLVAARPDRRARCGHQIVRPAAELAHERIDGDAGD